jgi:VWFA-related protein
MLALGLFATVALAQRPTNRSTPPAPPPQQQPSPQQGEDDDVVRITTNLVQVDAVVTDTNGRHVTNLGPENFEISEDGKRQEITNFSYVNVGPQAREREAPTTVARAEKGGMLIPPARLSPERLRRTIALVVDDLSLSVESTHVVRRALKKYLDEQIQSDDLSAILRTSSGVGVLQQFTSDKRLLNAAIERMRWSPRSRGGLSAVETTNPLDVLEAPAAGGVDGDKVQGTKDRREESSIRDTISALVYIVRGFQSLPGRKAVVLFTDSLPLDSDLTVERMRKLVDLANRSSVVFYSIDARGLQPLNFSAGEKGTMPHQSVVAQVGRGSMRQNFFEAQDGMNYLARETGGIFYREQNDFNKGIQRILDDQRGYYLIGYRPDASTFNQRPGQRPFHDLKVRVKAPGLSVRSRTGFYGVADSMIKAQPHTSRQQLLDAVSSPFGATGVDLRMAALFINDAERGSAVRGIIHVSAGDLEFTKESDGRRKAMLDVAAVIFASDGHPSVQGSDRREVLVTEQEYQRLLKNGLTYRLSIPVKQPGAYQLRVAVRDASSERVGSATEFVSVPDLDKGPLALSGIALAGVDPSQEATSTAAEQLTGSAGIALEVTDPGLSPAVRRLRHGVFLDYGYAIYNARLDKATGSPRLTAQARLFKDGKLVFAGSVTPLDLSEQKDMKRLVAGGRLQMGTELAPGDYILQVIVKDTLVGGKSEEGKRTVTQWVDFEVVD